MSNPRDARDRLIAEKTGPPGGADDGAGAGATASPYTITETLSRGPRATLLRAIRNADGRRVVLKVLDARHSRPKDLAQLKHEYELRELLDASFAAKPLALETHEGMPALVADDFGGRSLDVLIDGPMEVERFLVLAVRVAAAVAEVHQRGLVHKDLKPENIVVHPDSGEVRIVDFGLASLLPRDRQPVGPPQLIEGSLPYLSPEQTGRTNRAIDDRADLYSLGVTFYQMLTGRLPFEAKDPVEWVHCHVARAPPSPEEIVPGVPEMVSRVVLKLLAKMPEDRYQSARGLRIDLEACLAAWRASGRIAPFAPGAHDTPIRLTIPERLYGREADLALMREAYGRVKATGTPELLLVSGYSGIGKSALVRELEKPIIQERGAFISGKFDQYKRDIPHATLVQAFQELVLGILAESEEQIEAWRQRLLGVLGINARLIIDVIPHIELVVGRQPPPPELPPAEAQNRFRMVLRRFIGVFVERGRPLALFLDDLQWADSASLGLLEELLTHPEVRDLLVIGAYRDNEVSPTHPLMLAISGVRKAGARVSDVVLGPIPRDELAAFVAEALRCSIVDAAPLADLVHEKTAGNPFFAIQFLTALHEERLIELDDSSGSFRWDIAKIREKGFTDNVVDLMVGKLRRLPAATRQVLEQLACLGNAAESALLSTVHGGSEEGTRADLREAVRAGLVLCPDGLYKFLHDRVEEAAYSLVPEKLRAAEHLRIGRLLSSCIPPSERDEKIFEIVNQLNRGAALITSPEERERVAELNLVAGKRAKGSTAYASALSYLGAGTSLLGEDRWRRRYELTFALELDRAECEYLVGDFGRADALFDEILANARDNLTRARVWVPRLWMYQVAGRPGDGVAAMVEAVRSFGMTFPDSAGAVQAAIGAELRDVAVNLRGRPIADLADAPVASDPEVRALIGLLSASTPCAYIARPDLFPLIVLRALNLSLVHGNTEDSCFAYSAYGTMLVSAFGDILSGYQFSEMSIRLYEKLGGARMKGTLLYLHVHFIHFWRRPFTTGFPMLEKVLPACLEVGDLVFASYHAFHATWQTLEAGAPLDEVLQVSRRYAAFCAQIHSEVVYQSLRVLQQFVASLGGSTRDPAGPEGAFDEASCLALFARAQFGTGFAFYHLTKQISAFLFGRIEEAREAAARAAEVLGAVAALPEEATHHFYLALTLAAQHGAASPEARREIEEALSKELERHALWASHCPENFQNRHALVGAEVARIGGRDLDAMRLYQEAIRSAHENGFVQNEALAYELASRFYAARGYGEIAEAYLSGARAAYARWGADDKVKELDRRSPRLFATTSPTATIAARPEQLDLLAVTKASQTISGEIVLEDLIRTLLHIVLEQGGAQRACLVLDQDGVLSIRAEAALAELGAVTSTLDWSPVDGSSRLPASLVHYAQRTRERVILGDAAADAGKFADDPYFAGHRPRSVLAMPILRQAELVGLLYLENELLADAFTPGRLAALSMLATQAAISLENARLLARERAARVAAEEAERRAAFLAEASALLAQRLDEDAAFVRLARLCAGTLGEWCALDLVERGGEACRVAAAHRDPAREGALADLGREASARAMRTREMVTVADGGDELRRALGARALLATPLLSRGQVLGAILVGSSAKEGAPVDLVQEVARRLATAIDNSRLLAAEHEARVAAERAEAMTKSRDELRAANAALELASRAKDEFLAAMSHELRTPLNAVLGLCEALEEGVYGPTREEQRVAVGRIEASGRHLLSLITDILDLAKIGAGRMELEIAPVVVDEACRASLALVQEAAKRKQQALSLQVADEFATLLADERRLKQVLVNLLANAVKFTPEGGTIGLVAESDAEQVRFTVWDTGIGIAPEDQARLFQPFVQLDASIARKHAGTGLGLSLVRRLAELHGGRVEVESQLGRGSRFTVTLPRGADAPPSAHPAPVSSARPPASKGRGRILVVDDDETNAGLAHDYLESKGYEVFVAESGAEGIRLAEELAPDGIVMDVQMPEVDGLTAIRAIRASAGAARKVPIIAVTALAMAGDRERCLAAGADAYLSKPAPLKQLMETMEALRRRAAK